MTASCYIIPGDRLQDLETGEFVEVTKVSNGFIHYEGKTSEGSIRIVDVENFYKVSNI